MGTTNNVDTTVPGWKNTALTANLDSIKSGVYTALIGSGWRTDAETVADMTQHVALYLLDKSLDKWASYEGKNKNMLSGFCRWVAYQRTINHVKLSVHKHDGAVNAMRIDATDASADDKTPRVIVDETSAIAYLRVEQRERLELAMEALDNAERSHFEALMAGKTSAEWAASAGYSAVQATRQKKAIVTKLARLLAE